MLLSLSHPAPRIRREMHPTSHPLLPEHFRWHRRHCPVSHFSGSSSVQSNPWLADLGRHALLPGKVCELREDHDTFHYLPLHLCFSIKGFLRAEEKSLGTLGMLRHSPVWLTINTKFLLFSPQWMAIWCLTFLSLFSPRCLCHFIYFLILKNNPNKSCKYNTIERTFILMCLRANYWPQSSIILFKQGLPPTWPQHNHQTRKGKCWCITAI